MTDPTPDVRAIVSVILVHHADAVGPDVDPQRPLSARGRAQAEWLATQAKAVGVRPAAILHSGKLRARQTAEYFLRLCSPSAEFRMVRGLRPEDAPAEIADSLAVEDRQVLVVSHMPLLPALARKLAPASEAFPLHGMVGLSRNNPREYAEQWRLQPPD